MTQVIEFKLPELGENIEQGDLVRLMVAPGASVSAGQSVMEFETDKAVVEVPSSVSGTVQEIRVKEGDKIKVGQVIFTVDGAEGKAPPKPAAKAAAARALRLRHQRLRPKLSSIESSRANQPRAATPAPARKRTFVADRRTAAPIRRANSSFLNWARTFRKAISCA